MSESQFYCLFEQAKTKGIGLELYLAPSVQIPNGVAFEKIQDQQTSPQKQKQTAQIIVSNDAEKTWKELTRKKYGDGWFEEIKEPEIEIFATIDVEDFSYQDLVEKTDFQISQTGFSNFTKTQSQFLTELKAGNKIVLKGEFSPDLLQMLEPIITSKEPEFAGIGENLILIIEDKNCQKGQTYEPLNWLAQDDYEVEVFEESQQPEFTDRVFIEKTPNQTIDLSQSQQQAEAFIQARKDNFERNLNQNSMLRLIGHSGVGKSRLLKEFETNNQLTTAIYRELNAFENWANDNSNKTKILFIDESNIEDLHFTMFSPLKDEIQAGKTKKIFYQGKFYDLDANHKVVFAQNPAKYGCGRFEQKLFDDGKIPAIHLRDFSASYIYEKILKSAIYDQLSEEIRSENLPEDIFKDFAKPLIEEYQESNANKKSEEDSNQETVRELQEKMLLKIDKAISPKKNEQDIKTSNFISTNATKEVEEALTNAISVRQKQRERVFPNKAVGLNGVLLEGKEYKVEDLTKIISHWISQDETLQQHQNQTQNHQKIAENFLKCLNSNGGERLNLRMLKSNLPKILTKYEKFFKSPPKNSTYPRETPQNTHPLRETKTPQNSYCNIS